MKTIADLNADSVLAGMLDKKVRLQTGASSYREVRAYGEDERSGKVKAEEWIDILNNGVVRSLTRPLGCYEGNLALTIYCKAQDDGRAKKTLVRQLVSQCVNLADRKSEGGYYFELRPEGVITPTTVNSAIGYSITVLNVEWHTTDEFYNA